MEQKTETRRLTLGMVVITLTTLERLTYDAIQEGLGRHLRGDWGEVCPEDRRLNDVALVQGNRLLSAYTDSKGTKYWVITAADRSVTTLCLPDEF